MSDPMELFGTPKYGSGFKAPQKLKDGVATVFRIGPPFKSLAASGEWSWFGQQHFGYMVPGKDGPDAKPSPRPFACIQEEDRNTKMVTRDCPECTYLAVKEQEMKDAIELQRTKLKESGKTGPALEADLEEYAKPWKKFFKEHNLDSKNYLNVKFADGTFGPLAIPYTALKKLRAKIKECREKYKIDPIDARQGVWFSLTRTGHPPGPVDFNVDIVREFVDVGGRSMESIKPAPLTPDDFRQAAADFQDLPSVLHTLSYEQISALTKCGGDPEQVEAIMNVAQRRQDTSSGPRLAPVEAALPAPTPAAPQVVAAAATVHPAAAAQTPPVAAPAPAAPATDVAAKKAALLAQLALLADSEAAAAQPMPVAPAVTPAAPATSPAPTMSAQQFRGLFPDPNKV